MSSRSIIEDPQAVLDEIGAKGKFITDTSIGIEYYKPSPQEYEDLNAEYYREIKQTEKDHASFYKKIQDNERAYEAIVDLSEGGKPMLPVPIVRKNCDQIAAWFINTILRPHPIFSIDPGFPAEYQVPVEDPTLGRMLLPTTSEQVAAGLEIAVEYLVRERMRFRHIVDTVINETVKGRGPSVVKVVFDEKHREQYVTNISEGPLKIPVNNGRKLVTREEGDPVRVYVLPTENFLMPADEEDTLVSRWVSERVPMRPPHLRAELRKPQCLVPKGEWTSVEESTGEVVADAAKEFKAAVDGRYNSIPRSLHDVREIWFEHYVEEEQRVVKMMGLFHMGVGKFIWIVRNPYNHQRNPYVAFFQKKRPFRFSGSSTAEEMLPTQQIASEILHLAIQNAIIHNSSPLVADPDSDAWEYLNENDVDALSVIPGREGDVTSISYGRAHPGLMNELNFVMSLGRAPGNTQYDDGSYIPGRTSPNSISQIMDSGKQVPLTQLLGYAEGFCDVIWLYLKTYKQFRPYGEILYSMDEETRQLIEVPFRLPDEEALDNFRITLTAADEIAGEETNVEQLTLLANLLDKDADQLAKIIGPLVDMQMPQSLEPLLERLISRKQDVLDMYVRRTRVDSDRFVVSKEMLRSVMQEKDAMRQQQMQAQQMEAMLPQGAPPGVPLPPQGGMPGGNPVQPAEMAGPA